MAGLQERSITQRTVEALSVVKDTVFWDTELPGFGVRVYPSGSKYYVVQTRGPDGSKRLTLGRHGVIAADEARRRAALIIARIKAGEEPVPEPMAPTPEGEPTVAAIAARYLREHVAVRCKPGTVAEYRLAVDKHIVPVLGELPITAVGRTHVADLHYGLRDRPSTANLVVATLSRLIEEAAAWGVAPTGSNPCRHVRKYRMGRRERFLTDAEFRRLGRVLRELEAERRVPVHAVAALRLLMLTGCRRNEILTLRWRTWTWRRRSFGCQTARRVLEWFPCRRRRQRFWRHCRALPAIPGSSPAASLARGCRTSSSTGAECGRERVLRVCAFTTYDIASPAVRWRSVRAFR